MQGQFIPFSMTNFRFLAISWLRSCAKLGLTLISLSTLAVADDVSFYPERLDDKSAVYLSLGLFGADGHGIADDTAALQQAINQVAKNTSQGILFVPEGKYRISGTIYVWPGVRIIGYGQHRPVFILGANSPGFQGNEPKYMFYFTGNVPGRKEHIGFPFLPPTESLGGNFDFSDVEDPNNLQEEEKEKEAKKLKEARERKDTDEEKAADKKKDAAEDAKRVRDANPGTFYSALSNVDFIIEKGNPFAACIRAHYAQHCFLSHIDFHLGSGLAGIHDGGNYGEDLHFHDGHYGIATHMPSPGWQFCLVDATFEGQSVAAIATQHAGLTLIRPQFRDVPTAVSIDAGQSEQLWIKDGRMDGVTGPGIIISNEKSALTQINLENVVCRHVPVFASFSESGQKVAGPGTIYQVKTFSHGLHLTDSGEVQPVETRSDIVPLTSLPSPIPTDIAPLPNEKTWVNVKTLGIKGDAVHDDTVALRRAIATHRTLYFPSGAYLVSGTIELKPDTVLIGLHPSVTRFFLKDKTPAFQDVGDPIPILVTPTGGTNIVTGLGFYTDGINPRAAGIKWMAGSDSLLNDVRLLGGHGTSELTGNPVEVYNNNHTADPDINRRWDSEYPSLWITGGGGGTFTDIWTPNTFAQAGLVISNTSTPGRIYELSSEHHVRNEIKLRNASNWELFDLQTEEERGEGGFALPMQIDHCRQITLANFFLYRVVSSDQPFPTAVQISDSDDIRFRNFHCFSDSKVSFENAVSDPDSGLEIRQREFTSFTFSQKTVLTAQAPSIVIDSSGITKLPGSFYRASGGTVDPAGNLYFVDARWQRIYQWSPGQQKLSLLSDRPLQPVNLACDQSGNLLVISDQDAVYTLQPGQPDASIQVLKPVAAKKRSGLDAILPRNSWLNNADFTKVGLQKKAYQYLSPDNSTFIPAEEDFVIGALYYGAKMHTLLRTFGLQTVAPGHSFYITSEDQQKTYAATLDEQGSIKSLKLFANQGGESVATDSQGRVYIAAGQIFVYSPAGELIETIAVPERPLDLVFGGKDRRTLFILAGTSVYQARILVPGA
jgi:sugar lactone lactonase YvrE